MGWHPGDFGREGSGYCWISSQCGIAAGSGSLSAMLGLPKKQLRWKSMSRRPIWNIVISTKLFPPPPLLARYEMFAILQVVFAVIGQPLCV